jgi:hypothetical protein
MAGMAPIRTVSFLLAATCAGLCQQPNQRAAASLPDAPSARSYPAQTASLQSSTRQTSSTTKRQIFHAYAESLHVPVATPGVAGAGPANGIPGARSDLSYFGLGRDSDQAQSGDSELRDFFTRQFSAGSAVHSHIDYAAASGSFVGRASYAASSVVFTHDDAGNGRLNTSYLLRVLASAVVHSAARPYWKRSLSQPFSDFGATIGNDAGMNVLHEFSPGIRDLVKTHTPKFVSHIEEHFRR